MEKSPFPPDGGLLIDPGGLPGVVPWSSTVSSFPPPQSVVENNLTTVDDIKDQLRLLVNEIRSLRSRLDEMEASSSLYCGFDPHYSLPIRKKAIDSSTSLGRRPAKASALLVILILEALSQEPRTERSIKEYVVEQCRKCNVKVSSKGSITGSSLEVATVCAILAGLGLLEFSPSPPPSSSAAADADREKQRVQALANTLRERHELVNIPVREREPDAVPVNPAESVQVPSVVTSVATDTTRPEAAEMPTRAETPSLCQQALEELKIIESLESPKNTLGQEKEEFTIPRPEDSLAEVFSERDGDSAAAETTETAAAEMEFEELDMDDALSLLDKETEVEREATRQESTATENLDETQSAADKDTSTKKPNPVKLWRIVREKGPDKEKEKDKDKERTSNRRSLCIETDSLLNDVSQAVFLAQRTQEVEEKLLRRVATQCRLILPSQPLLLGTRYLDSQYEDVRPPASSSSSTSSAPVAAHAAEREKEREIVEHHESLTEATLSTTRVVSRDLLELPSSFTAQSLLQKVMSAKRERGLSLPVCQSHAVNASLPSTVNIAVFDARPVDALRRICERTKDALWRDGISQDTAGENTEKRERNRKRSLSVAEKDNEVPTLYDWIKTQASLSVNASTANVLSQQNAVMLSGDMPSVSVSSLKRYNPPLVLDEAPSSVVSNRRYVDLSICCEEIPWSAVAKEFVPIERDDNEHDKEKEKEKEKKNDKPEIDREPETVEAPMFREVESVDEYIKRKSSSMASAMVEEEKEDDDDDDEEEEDISDEAVLARHEFVLRGMREKWALMQRLKQETRAESSHGSLSARKGNHGSDGEMEGDKDAPTKKRGRPPKMHKLTQSNYPKS